jgi:hypothetical protein
MRTIRRLLLASLGLWTLALASCGDAGDDGPFSIDAGTCDPDPLRTGLAIEWSGLSEDMYDCPILELAEEYGEPDAMIFKAMIYVESRFQYDAKGCPNLPCGIPESWSVTECYCFGVMQIVPACGGTPADLGLLPNGHPNLTTDPRADAWGTSIYNPWINIELGIAGVAGNRQRMMEQFPGCTEDQYTMMAIGDYNSYGSTQSCTAYNFSYDDAVLEAYALYSEAAGWPAHDY